jgi:hypothetical protein
MALVGLNGRVARLERVTPVPQSAAQEERARHRRATLVVMRFPEETKEDALARWGIDPEEWGQIAWRTWYEWRPGEEIFPPMVVPALEDFRGLEEVLTRRLAELEAERRARQSQRDDGPESRA